MTLTHEQIALAESLIAERTIRDQARIDFINKGIQSEDTLKTILGAFRHRHYGVALRDNNCSRGCGACKTAASV